MSIEACCLVILLQLSILADYIQYVYNSHVKSACRKPNKFKKPCGIGTLQTNIWNCLVIIEVNTHAFEMFQKVGCYYETVEKPVTYWSWSHRSSIKSCNHHRIPKAGNGISRRRKTGRKKYISCLLLMSGRYTFFSWGQVRSR